MQGAGRKSGTVARAARTSPAPHEPSPLRSKRCDDLGDLLSFHLDDVQELGRRPLVAARLRVRAEGLQLVVLRVDLGPVAVELRSSFGRYRRARAAGGRSRQSGQV